MNNDHAMAIVCDLALCIGREVTLDALLTKVLQRFLFHCACPVGLVLQQLPQGEYKIIKAIGDEQLLRHQGEPLALPHWVSDGEQCILRAALPLPGSRPYPFAYRLRIEGGYLMLLLSPNAEQQGEQLCHLFSPILGNLARAIQLCRDSEQLALRQQAELVDMQRFNESLLKAIPIPVFYKDVEGRFISCNPTFTQITGISKTELQGKRVDEILPPEMADEYTQRDLEVLRSRQPQYFEHTLFDRSGHRYQVLNFKDLFYDHQGEVAGIIGALVDITHIKESEQQQRCPAVPDHSGALLRHRPQGSRHRGPRAARARSRAGHRPASAALSGASRWAGPRRHGAQHRPVADPGGDPHPPPRTEGGGVRAHQAAPAGGV